MKAAAELLRDSQSVSEVADKLGLNSQSYFPKAFKQETGTSPSDMSFTHMGISSTSSHPLLR